MCFRTLLKLGDFEFSKHPDIFRSHYGRRSSRFFLAGSFQRPEERFQLQKTIDAHRILELASEQRHTDRVVVVDSHFSSDAIWGNRYELVLAEYTPMELTRREIATNNVEELGEKVFSPRFRIIADYSNGHEELPRGDTLDYKVELRVDLCENSNLFKLKFKDQHLVQSARSDFSRWTKSPEVTIEVLLGYLEQGNLLPVIKGKVGSISHGINASGNWVSLEGKGESHGQEQKYVYSINDNNIFSGSVERTSEGRLRAHIETTLLPDLKPKDIVDFHSKNLGLDFQDGKPDSITHLFSLSRGGTTRFAFVKA